MKLLIIIVQDTDASGLREELTKNNFASTKLNSTGSFLREGNTTFIVGVDDAKVAEVSEIIRKTCKQRSRLMPTAPYLAGAEGMFSEPMEVLIGGAVVFVMPLDEIFRL